MQTDRQRAFQLYTYSRFYAKIFFLTFVEECNPYLLFILVFYVCMCIYIYIYIFYMLSATEAVENITDNSINIDAKEDFTVGTLKSRPDTMPVEEFGRYSQQFSYHSEGHINYIGKFVCLLHI